MNRTQLLTIAVTAALGLSVGAAAQAGVIIKVLGGNNQFYETDKWTSITDTGVDVGPPGASFAIGERHTFSTQTRVGTFTLNGPVLISLVSMTLLSLMVLRSQKSLH